MKDNTRWFRPNVPDPMHSSGQRFLKVDFHRTKGRPRPDPQEDPDALPDAMNKMGGMMAIFSRFLIDGEHGDNWNHSRTPQGGASDGYRNRMTHQKMRDDFMNAKVDLGEEPQWIARCFTGTELHEFLLVDDQWRLERVSLTPDWP